MLPTSPPIYPLRYCRLCCANLFSPLPVSSLWAKTVFPSLMLSAFWAPCVLALRPRWSFHLQMEVSREKIQDSARPAVAQEAEPQRARGHLEPPHKMKTWGHVAKHPGAHRIGTRLVLLPPGLLVAPGLLWELPFSDHSGLGDKSNEYSLVVKYPQSCPTFRRLPIPLPWRTSEDSSRAYSISTQDLDE